MNKLPLWSRAMLGALLLLSAACAQQPADAGAKTPYIVVLGIAQDGGVPQIGSVPPPMTGRSPSWQDLFIQRQFAAATALRRLVVSLAVVDPMSEQRWLFEATPDIKEQLYRLDTVAPVSRPPPGLTGVFLTHAHIGHYTGLAQFGHEALGAKDVPVYAMPRMHDFLLTNGPWDQLVSKGNIALLPLMDGQAIQINARLTVTPVRVPHRQEYSEVVGFVIAGPEKRVLFIPDIDSWEQLDALASGAESWQDDETATPAGRARRAAKGAGAAAVRTIEELIASVDVAYLDATFYANGEIPGRDMTGFPHPFISHSMQRFASLPAGERAKIRFIHLNHTNPALLPGSAARKAIEAAGFSVAEEMERVGL